MLTTLAATYLAATGPIGAAAVMPLAAIAAGLLASFAARWL